MKKAILVLFWYCFSFHGFAQPYVYIPDPAFRAAIDSLVPGAIVGTDLNTMHPGVWSLTLMEISNSGIADLTGIQYFPNLTELYCTDNLLSTLPPLPPNLTLLYVNNNELTALPALPPFLERLRCYENLLTSLPAFPSTLEHLWCNNNNLDSLPSLPPGLIWLFCDDNQLTSIPPLPSTLQFFSCTNNLLTVLPTLPDALTNLWAAGNPDLWCLPNLPSNPDFQSDIGNLICTSRGTPDAWYKMSNISIPGTEYATAFAIGSKCYFGTGSSNPSNTFWEFNPDSNVWTQKANFPGASRRQATSFSIGAKGYLGLGKDSIGLFDFWEYDPVFNIWTRKADYPGIAFTSNVAFSIGDKGYVGCGSVSTVNYQTTFYEFDPVNNTWTQKANFAGFGIMQASCFTIGNKGYVCGGEWQNDLTNTCFRYDPILNTWSQIASLPFSINESVSFATNGKGYIATGQCCSWGWSPRKFLLEYDVSSNAWSQLADMPTAPRMAAAGCAVNGRGYVGTGELYSVYTGYSSANDWWEYTPACQSPSSDIYASGSTGLCNDSVMLFVENGNRYVWQRNGVPINGATTSFYYAKTAGTYTCILSNDCDTVTSASIVVTGNAAPVAAIMANGNTAICTGNTVMLNAGTGVGRSYQWTLNNVNIVGANSASYYAGVTGDYACIVSNSCGSDTSNTLVVTAYSPITPMITAAGSTTFCAGGSVLLSANSGAGINYQWQRNGTWITGATSSSYSATISGNFTCLETNVCSYVTSNTIVVTVSNIPTASITAGGSLSFCAGDSVLLSANTGTGLGYQWSRNGGIIPGAITSSFSASTAGDYTCTLTNACGSTASNILTVIVNAPPIVTISAVGSPFICVGSFVTLNASSVTGLTYQWKLDNVTIGGAVSSSYNATAPGNYTCEVIYSCGSTTSNTLSLSILPPPPATITAGSSTILCTGDLVLLSANTGTGLTYQWNRNGGIISGAIGSGHLTNTPGDYTCTVTNVCGSTTSNTLTVLVEVPPPANISAGGSTTFCSGDSVTLYANTGPGLSYQWRRGLSNIPGATSSSYVANASFSYSCVVTNTCWSSESASIAVTVNTPPSASIAAGGNTTFCNGGSVTLNANTGIGLTYQWKLNGGNISGAVASSYSATAPGNYSCDVTNSCGSTTSNIIAVTVNTTSPASITAGGSTTFCSGGSVTLNANTGTGLTYQWSRNGGAIGGATASSYAATTSGNYTCTVTNLCGSTTSNTLAVTVNTAPPATISAGGSTTFCSGGSVTFTANTGTGLSYQWKLNAVNIGGATTSSYTASVAGNYVCVVTNSCGSTTSNNFVVTVNALPSASITAGGPINFCTGGSVTLNANTGAGLTYQWRLNGSNISGATASSYSASAAGNFTCVVTNSCGNTTSNTIAVTVSAVPAATIAAGGPTTFCPGGSVTLDANTGTGLSWQWMLNGGNIAGATSSFYLASAAGNYTCIVTNTCGSTSSNTIGVIINATPPAATITAGGSTNICTGGSVTLNANTGTGLSYQWDLNGSAIPGATASSYAAAAAGNYDCVVTNSCGSTTSNTLSVTVNAVPVATISAGGSTSFCTGGSVTLNANTGTGLTYQWKMNGTIIGGATLFTYSATVAGNYSCEVTNSCGSTASNLIAVNVLSIPPTPGVINGLASGICGNTTDYTIGAVAGATSYNWTVPGGVILNSGQGTATLNITYPIPFSSGSIRVNAENTCGTSGSASLALTSVLAPAGPILGLADVCEMKTYVYSIAPVAGATNYTWTVPTKARIQHGQGSATAEIKMNRYAGNITVTASNACMTSATSVLAVTITTVGCGPMHKDNRILDAEVYPNPSTTEFTLKIYSDDDSKCQIILRDITGRVLEQREQVAPGSEITFGNYLANGIYLAEVLQGDERVVLRVVKSE